MKNIKKSSLLFLTVFVLFQCQMPYMQLLETAASMQQANAAAVPGQGRITAGKSHLTQKTNTKNRQEIRTEAKSVPSSVQNKNTRKGNSFSFLSGRKCFVPCCGKTAVVRIAGTEKNYISFSSIADKRAPPAALA